MKSLIKKLPLLILIALFIVFYVFDLNEYFSFSGLQEYHSTLQTLVGQHYFLSLILFFVSYTLVTATSLPIPAFLTILGGYLFGPWVCLLVVDLSATLGATLLFLAVNMGVRDFFQAKAAPWLKKMEKGFQKNAFSYLLFLRLIPLFPFWAINIAAALLGVHVRTFALATVIGIIPGTLVYAFIGNGLGSLLKKGKAPDLYAVLTPEILIPLCALGLLSLLPLLFKKVRQKR